VGIINNALGWNRDHAPLSHSDIGLMSAMSGGIHKCRWFHNPDFILLSHAFYPIFILVFRSVAAAPMSLRSLSYAEQQQYLSRQRQQQQQQQEEEYVAEESVVFGHSPRHRGNVAQVRDLGVATPHTPLSDGSGRTCGQFAVQWVEIQLGRRASRER
jgi:hypothetical protein